MHMSAKRPLALDASDTDDEGEEARVSDRKRLRNESLMGLLDRVLARRTTQEIEHERVQKENRRLMCGAAAECRRWSRDRSDKGPLPFPSLMRLAEEALGSAWERVCEEIRPHYDYCSLRWVPSAVDHNGELCRLARDRPAVERWGDQ